MVAAMPANAFAMQEFMILPVGAAIFTEAMKLGCEVHHNLKALIKGKYVQDPGNVANEGVFLPASDPMKRG